jgi:hypothetical protein
MKVGEQVWDNVHRMYSLHLHDRVMGSVTITHIVVKDLQDDPVCLVLAIGVLPEI